MPFLSSIAFRALVLISLSTLVSSCANRNPGERRLNKFPELSNNLTDQERSLIARKEIAEGMSQDAVFLAWGRPDRVRTSSQNGRKSETWTYLGSTPVASPSISVGVGSRGFHSRLGVHPTVRYGTNVDFARHVEREVIFVNDRVIRWERVR